jgi:hypothetical protein
MALLRRSATLTPRIVYLDQNKWIELARAEKAPSDYPDHFALLERLRNEFAAGQALFPLSAANIFETFKIGDPRRRNTLATLQATLSGGLVFRGRYRRLEEELSAFLAVAYDLEPKSKAPFWFLSNLFYEAFSESDDVRLTPRPSGRLIEFIRQHPATALRDYLTTAPDDERLAAVRNWSAGSEVLRARVEERRTRNKNESLSMRRRIYNVHMFMGDIHLLASLAAESGVQWNSTSDIDSSVARRLVEEMPVYHIERELAVRLEAQLRPINENDFRDVQAYCASIPYADVVVGENLVTNLARQARLDEKYDTKLETDLLSLAA